MEESLDKNIRKKAVEKGLILGIIGLVLGIFTFYLITEMTQSMLLIITAPIFISIIIPIAASAFLMNDLRKQVGGYWTFKQAVSGAFIMFLVAYAVTGIGRDLVFAKLIEPQMVEKMGSAVISTTGRMLEKSKADQTQIDEKIAEMEKQFNEQAHPTIGNILEGIVISIIFVFIFALIFAAIFKRERLRNSLDDAIDPTV
jgi:tetrahydromethanopterin S-methyltransferase subunit G